MLFNGIVDLILAHLIFAGWSSTAAWAIGLLVGVTMMFPGLSLTTTALAGVRHAAVRLSRRPRAGARPLRAAGARP